MSNKFNEKQVTITKVIDDTFEGNHPKGINEGYTATGRIYNFEVGHSATVIRNDREFKTSPIRTINEDAGIFETKNSTYKIELVQEDEGKELTKMSEADTTEAPQQENLENYANAAM